MTFAGLWIAAKTSHGALLSGLRPLAAVGAE